MNTLPASSIKIHTVQEIRQQMQELVKEKGTLLKASASIKVDAAMLSRFLNSDGPPPPVLLAALGLTHVQADPVYMQLVVGG